MIKQTLDNRRKLYYYENRYERKFERRKDMAQEDKLKALDAALAQIEKQFGKGSVMKLDLFYKVQKSKQFVKVMRS